MLWGYVPILLLLGMALLIVVHALRKKGKLYSHAQVPETSPLVIVEFAKRNENLINFVICISAAAFTVFVVLFLLPPFVRDLPYVLDGRYRVGKFQTIENRNERRGSRPRLEMRSVLMVNLETGEEIQMRIGRREVQIGEVLILEYLPNTGINRTISFEGVRPLPLDNFDSW